MKLEPVAVMVRAAPPAVALLGEMEVSAGCGLLMANETEFEFPPLEDGLLTTMVLVPAEERADAGRVALRLVALE
jgi:hypothetical protein